MDLVSEASKEARVLATRHISAEQALPEANTAINTTILCYSYSLQPDFGSYLAALHTYAWVLWTCGLCIFLATCVVYAVSLRSALQHWRESISDVAMVLAVYPVVSAAAFIAIVVPRARILTEAISQQAVMVAMYYLYCVVIAECGGPEQLIRRTGGSRLETRVLPCCCWPCCVIPRPKLQKRNLTWLRYLVLQMPVIQAFMYIIILTLWVEDLGLYVNSFMYLQPFIAASILSGVWGMIMCVRAAEAVGHKTRPRFLVLQLVLLIVKLQCGLAKMLPEVINMPCLVTLNPSVFANMIQNSVMMLEMLLLSIWAWRLYRVPPGKDIDMGRQVVVATLDDNVRAIEVRTINGVENKSFNSEQR